MYGARVLPVVTRCPAVPLVMWLSLAMVSPYLFLESDPFNPLPPPPAPLHQHLPILYRSVEGIDTDADEKGEKAARAAVEHALMAAKNGGVIVKGAGGICNAAKVFSELEGVDEAVSVACNSVIRVLLQVRIRVGGAGRRL